MKRIYQLLLNIFLFFVFIVLSSNSIFASEDNEKTIKQLKDNIEVLKSKKIINFSEFEKFKQVNGELANYFSKSLSEESLKKIEIIIINHNSNKVNIQKSVDKNKTIELIELKKDLYNQFYFFIDESKIDLYNEFVRKNISTLEKWDEIKKDIESKEKIIEDKVSTIKEKIEQNHKKEQEKLDLLLKIKIKSHILKFKNSEKIQLLWKEKQKILLEVILNKILEKKTKTNKITEKQIKLYIIIEEVILEIIKEL